VAQKQRGAGMIVTLKKARRHGDAVYIWVDGNGHEWEVYQSPNRLWRYIRDDHYASSIGYLTMEDARSALERAWEGTL
jgi:hypothetical protein